MGDVRRGKDDAPPGLKNFETVDQHLTDNLRRHVLDNIQNCYKIELLLDLVEGIVVVLE